MNEILAAPAAAQTSGAPGDAPGYEPRQAPPQAPASNASWQTLGGQSFDPLHKSPLLAAALSVIPGIGQFYIGYYARGFVTGFSFLTVVAMAGNARGDLGPLLGFSAMFLWIFNIIDAGRMAALYNHATAGGDSVNMPRDFKLPGTGGTMVGGVALMIFGAIALSNTLMGVRLDWLQDWWPVFPLALGAYLLFRGITDSEQERQARSAMRATAAESAYDLDRDVAPPSERDDDQS